MDNVKILDLTLEVPEGADIRAEAWGPDHQCIRLAPGVSIIVANGEVEKLHAVTASALFKGCRPRTVEEMLAGHTRAALRLVDDALPTTPRPA